MMTAVLLLGGFMRLYALAGQSFWRDELASLKQVDYPTLIQAFREGAYYSVHPPGYHLVVFTVTRVLGDSEIAVRFPSALAGLLAIAFIYQSGRLLYGRREGVIAAVLLAVLWCPLYYSQEGRAYALLLQFSLAATYFALVILRSLEKQNRPPGPAVAGYMVTAVATTYLHYFGLYLIALQGLAAGLLFIHRRRALLRIVAIYLPIGLAYLPWLPAMLFQLNRGATWITAPQSSAFGDYFAFLFNKSAALLLLVVAFYIILLGRNLQALWANRAAQKPRALLLSSGVLLVAWLLLPMAGVYVKSLTSAPVLTNRNLIISLPAAYLLLARAVTRLPLRRRGQNVAAGLLVGLFLYHLLFVLGYYTRPQKAQIREVVAYVVERDALYPNALIAAHKGRIANYYFEQLGSDRRIDTAIAGTLENIPKIVARMEREERDHLWLLSTTARGPTPEFLAGLQAAGFTIIDEQPFFRGYVWLFGYARREN